VKDYVAEATSRLCAETAAEDGTTARDTVSPGSNRMLVCAVLCFAYHNVTYPFGTKLSECSGDSD